MSFDHSVTSSCMKPMRNTHYDINCAGNSFFFEILYSTRCVYWIKSIDGIKWSEKLSLHIQNQWPFRSWSKPNILNIFYNKGFQFLNRKYLHCWLLSLKNTMSQGSRASWRVKVKLAKIKKFQILKNMMCLHNNLQF